jgi:DNA-binding beta-propeller fold protein YncE
MTVTQLKARMLRLTLVPALLGVLVALPAGAEVLYVASNRVEVFDSDSGKRLAEIPLDHFVFDIVFNADGSRAYLAIDDGVLEVDAKAHTVLGRLLDGPSFGLDLSADGTTLTVLGNDVRRHPDGQQEALPSHLTIVDLATRKVTARHEVGLGAEELGLAGGRVAVTRPEGRELMLVSLEDGATAARAAFTEKKADEEVPGAISGLATSPDGKQVYLGQFGAESSIHVMDAATGTSTELPFKHEGFITGLKLSADGSVLYVMTRNHVAVLDAATGAERAFIPLGGAHMRMAVSPGDQRSYHTLPAANEQGGAVTVVNLAEGKVERTFSTPGISPFTIGVRP